MNKPFKLAACTAVLAFALISGIYGISSGVDARMEGTPEASWSCADLTTMATPGGDHSGMDMSTPDPGDMDMNMDMDMDIDQVYIDMMIPHHLSVVALAEAALPELADERLVTIAEAIIAAQTAEVEELLNYREAFYGDREIMPMDDHMMGMMMDMMPGMGSMEDMMFQMNAEAQVLAFCGADDPDLAFIDMVIPHHEMAIVSSEPVVESGIHPEIVAFAERVIADQQAEIDQLETIREDLESN
jgi:uncharacterized protein (DUF305 family)